MWYIQRVKLVHIGDLHMGLISHLHQPLPNPVPVHNIDGTLNENGSIMEEVKVILQYGQHMEKACLAVTNLGQQTVIIGHSWLTHHNPEVDWACQSIIMSQLGVEDNQVEIQ